MLKGPAPARDLDPWPREARPEPYPARPRARRGHSPHGGRGEQHPAPRALTRLGAKPSPSSWHPGRPGPACPSWMSPEPGPSSLGICHDVTMGKKEAAPSPSLLSSLTPPLQQGINSKPTALLEPCPLSSVLPFPLPRSSPSRQALLRASSSRHCPVLQIPRLSLHCPFL